MAKKRRTHPRCSRTGKRKFFTELDCQIAISRTHAYSAHHRKMKRDQDVPIRAYQCEFCSAWHMTGQTKGEGRGVA